MEYDLNFLLLMEDDLNFFLNGRQPLTTLAKIGLASPELGTIAL